MSGLWRGNLRNTGTDMFTDTIILVATICAYVPQISRLRSSASTCGISAYSILFNMFFSNAQLSQVLLCAAYAWPTASRPVLKQIEDGSLKGWAAIGGILGLLQIFAQWLCSLAVLISFVTVDPQTSRSSGRTTLIMAFLHALVVLLPAFTITLPQPSAPEFGRDITMALINMSNLVVAPCFVFLQFYAQFLQMRIENGNPGALSLLSICLQVPATALIGLRWFLRLGNPTWGNLPASIWLWYEWGFPALNYASHAVGCVLLLACYFSMAYEAVEYSDLEDRIPLLG